MKIVITHLLLSNVTQKEGDRPRQRIVPWKKEIGYWFKNHMKLNDDRIFMLSEVSFHMSNLLLGPL